MNPKSAYETTFIVNAGLEDHSVDSVIDNVREFVQNHGGAISNLDKWGRKRLAYPIQKKNNGFYVYMRYDAPTNLQPLLERFFQLEENIIRHLTVQLTAAAIEYRDKPAEVVVVPGEEAAAPVEDDKAEVDND
jgi:small subunit ribosomal protein S6